MDLFRLPRTAKVNRVIPKNAFDDYTTAKQKRLFTDLIAKITWTHKLSTDTINLEGKDIEEIQVFRIELKMNKDIKPVLDIIDKSIPYAIIYVIEFDGKVYISTSTKHPHPLNENNAVIDWTFKTDWFPPSDNRYALHLKKSIDDVYHDFCIQLSGESSLATRPLQDLVDYEKRVDALKKEISRLKAGIAKSKQFNKKVELNLKLKELESELHSLQLRR